jgi:(p)ppGpp synthase/HD superfamily hydrolase
MWQLRQSNLRLEAAAVLLGHLPVQGAAKAGEGKQEGRTAMIDLPTLALGFAMCAHRNQRRKYTGEPYANHCRAVAVIVADYTPDPAAIAAACLHDTVEDTEVTADQIHEVFGERVAALVLEVTDVSRPEDGNREARKRLDREHVARSSPDGATIKLADLIDNTSSIVKYDKGFARNYLQEKAALLEVLKHGNRALWDRTYAVLQEAQHELVQHRLSGAE